MRAETALWCALLVILGASLPVAALGPAAVAGGSATFDARAGGQPTATPSPAGQRSVHLHLQLRTSGSAAWTVETYVPLESESDREAFRELGRRYENGTADVAVTADLFRRYVEAADAESGREMRIPASSVERSWTVENGTGVLRLAFTWTNFAREEGNRLVVDDAFRTESGTWLPRLADGQVLVVRPPAGVGFVETPPGKGVTDNRLRWEGPQSFGPDYFHIVYRVEDTETPGTPPTTSPGSPASETPADPIPGMGPIFAGIVAVGAVVGYLVFRRRPFDGDGPVPLGTADGGGPPAAGAESDPGADATPVPADAAADHEGEAAEPTPEDPFAGVDVEMLSDEERVLRLLKANGGRMKQARIVRETDWSNAKVSQMLSGMDDDDEIDKLRIGRENLISLPDVEVDQFPD